MDENLSELRKKIDSADEMLINGFTDRMKAAAAIGEYKKQNGLPVYDAVREENKLEAVAKLLPKLPEKTGSVHKGALFPPV